MSMTKLFVITAVISAILLLVFQPGRLSEKILPIIAVVASVWEALIVFRVARLSLPGVNTMLVLGATLAIVGGIMYARMPGKTQTAAATLLTFVGAIQLLTALSIL